MHFDFLWVRRRSTDEAVRHSGYGMDAEQRATYERNLEALLPSVQFWPPIPQVKASALKITTIGNLDTIAQVQRGRRPATIVLSEGDEIVPGTMLKRSHGDCGKQVVMPSNTVRRNWTYLSSQLSEPHHRWMMQEYVPALETVGEWRVFVVGGRPMHVVHTRRLKSGKWMGRRVENFCMLQEIE